MREGPLFVLCLKQTNMKFLRIRLPGWFYAFGLTIANRDKDQFMLMPKQRQIDLYVFTCQRF